MNRNLKRMLSFALAFLLVATAGFMPTVQAADMEQPPAVGEEIYGFTVDSVTDSSTLSSTLIAFTHKQSGARLLYIMNEDPEVAFSISYNTPYVDETDTNHIFEHAILASSEKYPSTNIFFDMAGRTYNTYINASTYPAFTTYPISSMSEEQLMTMMDVYLSCMAAPEILTNENIYKREALRYTLYDPDDQISMVGTVFSEDFADLTDVSSESYNNVIDALYPGQYASNYLGRAHRNYQDLSYQSLLATYDRCYHFDNSLILLYGDLSYRNFLKFIDEEYLSKATDNQTDLSAYQDKTTEPGQVEVTVPYPAYVGDTTENASQIVYAISFEDSTWKEIMYWDLMTTILNKDNSAFYNQVKAAGIQNRVASYISPYDTKPYLEFVLYNGEPEQAQAFQQAVQKTLEQVAEEGIDPEVLRTTLKQTEMSSLLIRDTGNVGVDIFPDIVNYWVHTGKLNYYELFEQVLKEVEQDTEQTIFRSQAEKALHAQRSALVTTVPEPGLAEEIIAEQEAYLADMKASMTDEEIQQLIQDTLAFDAWNESAVSNSDFVIGLDALPEVTAEVDYREVSGNGIDYYLSPAEVEGVGSFYMAFDISEFSNDDIRDLALYRLLAGSLDTQNYSQEQLQKLTEEYLYDWYSYSEYPPDSAAEEEMYPRYALGWICQTQDFEKSLELIIELYGKADFSDTARVQEILARYVDSYDRSRTSSFLNWALNIAEGYTTNCSAFWLENNGQNIYYYLKEVQQKLAEDPGYGAELARRMEALADKLFQKGRMVFIAVAPEDELEQIQQTTDAVIQALPTREESEIQVVLDVGSRDVAIAVESSNQASALAAYLYAQDDFKGRYIPFLMAAEDQYLIPKLRFQMGAYSAGVTFSLYTGQVDLYSSSDPNAAATLEVFDGIGDFIADMELTQEDLNGYILTSLSSYGQYIGVLYEPMQILRKMSLGYDIDAITEMINDMKNATVADQQAAAEAISKLFASGSAVTLGNETVLAREQDAYDQFVSYKNGGQTTAPSEDDTQDEQPVDPGDDSDETEQAWYSDIMDYIREEGLFDPESESTPNNSISRSALITALWRMEGQPAADAAVDFSDVAEDAAYAEAVRWAAGEGVAVGYGDGQFGPNDTVTREQFAVMLHCYVQNKGGDVSVGEDTNILSYADAFDVSQWAVPAMQWACGAGVIQGDDKGLLNPQSQCTYAEAAAMLMQLCQSAAASGE